nr:S-protein homolog 29-like [Coffea arabica]
MSYASKNNLIISLLILAFYIVQTQHANALFEKYKVVIRSGFNPEGPGDLTINCFSGDDFFGDHILKSGQEFYWNFRMYFLDLTEYRCDFTYNHHLVRKFKVFDSGIAQLLDWPKIQGRYVVFWYVKEDGFYHGDDYPSLAREHLLFSTPERWTTNTNTTG